MKSSLTILLFFLVYLHSNGQSVVASAGQSGSNNTMQASATVGETIIGSSSTTGAHANQGFQQPLQSDLSTSIHTPQGQLVDVTLSPNPALDRIKLSFSKEVFDIRLMIYTSSGSLVRAYSYEGPRLVLEESLASLHSGNYYLTITDKEKYRLGSLPLIIK